MISMTVITEMNYEQIDLNLLRVFDAVMTELNVTRAADRLHDSTCRQQRSQTLTPSAKR